MAGRRKAEGGAPTAVSGDAPVLIYTTWPDAETAEQAGGALVARQLAACVNVLAGATAIYAWQGEVQRDAEWPMLIKTTAARVEAVAQVVKQMHPYDVPAFAVLDIAGGDPAFLDWIAAQTAPGGSGAGGRQAATSNGERIVNKGEGDDSE